MLLCALSIWTALAPSARAETVIEWELENAFRLFKRPEDTQLHRKAYEQLTPDERKNPILAIERKLAADSGGRGWADKVFNETCYNQDADRYTACPNYVLPGTHRIIATLKNRSGGDASSPSPADSDASCAWRAASAAGRTIAEVSAPCAEPVALDIPYPEGAQVEVATSDGETVAPIQVAVRDVLIVGMGDSFAAGEGNPDHPIAFDDTRTFNYGSVDLAATGTREHLDGYPSRGGNWDKIGSNGFEKERARWWDKECHRSLYSHQLRTALQLAIENPKRAITFVSFSCSGSEITDGLMLRKPVRECTPGEDFQVPAQFTSLSEELCESPIKDAPMPAAIINRVPELRNMAEEDMRLTRCPTVKGAPALKRPVDLVLLSVGGNDVGFVSVVSDTLLADNSMYRTLGASMDAVYGVDKARKRLNLVKQRFDGLRFALDVMFGVRSETGAGKRKVILTGYPNMGYESDGASACAGTKGMEVFPPFQFNAAKVATAEGFTQELNSQLAQIAGSNWTYVDGYRDEFRTHGLCATNGEGEDDIGFPRFKDGVWTPFKPSEYAPYLQRQRWFRTPNDAFLTANMHARKVANFGANCSGLYTTPIRKLAQQYWTPFQVFLSSTYGGAFHPTAEGQAAMADKVTEAARNVVDRQ